MSSLRLVSWNCHHGSLDGRLAELGGCSADIAFLQEFTPSAEGSIGGRVVERRIGPRKSIALGSLNANYQLVPLRRRPRSGRAVVAAAVTGPVPFTVIGIWSRGPGYASDVMRTLDAYARVLAPGPVVVMGDLNCGTDLKSPSPPSPGHSRIVRALEGFGLVSAYHAFHQVEHGYEAHATYRHLFKASQPWHIDFCFVPAGWTEHLTRVDVIDDDPWTVRSDHFPVSVEFRLGPGGLRLA